MFEIVKNVILSKNYKLEDILNKINVLWLESKLSDEEKTSLISLSKENALAENSYKPIQEQLNNLYKEFDDFKVEVNARLDTLEGKGDIEEPPTEPTETVEDEYPEYVQPSGAHDAYNIGDKITYNGKKYICKIKGCVWNPDVYPAGWQEVVEETETEKEV